MNSSSMMREGGAGASLTGEMSPSSGIDSGGPLGSGTIPGAGEAGVEVEPKSRSKFSAAATSDSCACRAAESNTAVRYEEAPM